MELYISNTGQEPIYAQITRQIKEQILSGTLKEGDALPSIRLLAKELRISVITTKRAYEDLEADGFIVTAPGKGSFVAAQNPELRREFPRRRQLPALPAAPRLQIVDVMLDQQPPARTLVSVRFFESLLIHRASRKNMIPV